MKVIKLLDFYNPDQINKISFKVYEGGVNCFLGINILSHDSSLALINENGEILYAISEERLSNIKHDGNFPFGAIIKCQELCQKNLLNITQIAVNFRPDYFPINTLNQIVNFHKIDLKDSDRSIILDFLGTILSSSNIEKEFLNLQKLFNIELNKSLVIFYLNQQKKYLLVFDILNLLFPTIKINFFDHHDCHHYAAIISSGFEKGFSFVFDGHGEFQSTTVIKFNKNGIEKVKTINYPYSIGSVYLLATRLIGYDYGDEFRVMGMSAYGNPEQYMFIFDNLVSDDFTFQENDFFGFGLIENTGQYRIEAKSKLLELIKKPKSNNELQQTHFDFAASVQKFTELYVSNFIKSILLEETDVVISGGVGLNGLVNDVVRKLEMVKQIYIYPASGDDGTAVGAAIQLVDFSKVARSNLSSAFYFGGEFSDDYFRTLSKYSCIEFSRAENINEEIAKLLDKGNIIARYNGRSEFGPRALGNRSILADPSILGMKDILNLRIKQREKYRPFAPACLLEDANKYFDLDEGEVAPYMILITQVKKITKELYPEIVHNDGTGRVQTLTIEDNPDFYKTVSSMKSLFNKEVLINTSFNVNGEAIVETPEDAIESFIFMDIDYLAIGNYLVKKKNSFKWDINHQDYLNRRKKRYYKFISDISSISDLDMRGLV